MARSTFSALAFVMFACATLVAALTFAMASLAPAAADSASDGDNDTAGEPAAAPITLDVNLDIDGIAVPSKWPYVSPGEEVTWSYLVTNNGDQSLSGLSISDARSGEVCAINELLPASTQECQQVMVAGETLYATTVWVLQSEPLGSTDESVLRPESKLAQSSAGMQVLVGPSSTSWLPAGTGATPDWPVRRWAPPSAAALAALAAAGWWIQRQVVRRSSNVAPRRAALKVR